MVKNSKTLIKQKKSIELDILRIKTLCCYLYFGHHRQFYTCINYKFLNHTVSIKDLQYIVIK